MSIVGMKAQTLVIWGAEKVLQRVDLKTKPVVKLLDDKYVVTGEGISLEYKLTDLRRFTFENLNTSVGKVKGATRTVDGGKIILCDAANAAAVSLCTIEGRQVPVKLVRDADGMALYLDNLPAGVYLLTVNGQTTKLTKK